MQLKAKKYIYSANNIQQTKKQIEVQSRKKKKKLSSSKICLRKIFHNYQLKPGDLITIRFSHLIFSCTFRQGKHKFKSQIWFISFCWSYIHLTDLESRFSRNKIWSLPPFKGQSNILHNIGGQSERAMMLKISLIIIPPQLVTSVQGHIAKMT